MADSCPEIESVIGVAAGTYLIFFILCKKCKEKREVAIIVAAYLLHLFILVLDLYGRDYISILHSGSDSEAFYRISVSYYNGDFTSFSTWYPYVINAIYHVVGLNRFLAQYVNVLFWFASMMVMRGCCDVIGMAGKYRKMALLFLGFFPNYVCLTSILLRESMVSFFAFSSFYFFLRWMRGLGKKNVVLAFLFSVPGIILHTSVIALWGVYVIAMALYKVKKGRFGVSGKSLFVIAFGCMGLALGFAVPTLRYLLFNKIPSLENGLIGVANYTLDVKSRAIGGSDYLVEGVSIGNYRDLVWRTLQRMVYFWLSPLPGNWRGARDMVAFFGDSIFYLAAILVCVWTVISKKCQPILTISKRRPYLAALFMSVLIFTAFCAWGVSNAGTAMRHRDKIIGIVVLMFAYSLQIIKKRRRYGVDIGGEL